jgi:uncharacterized protein YgbK (DUF1537 family)
MNAQAAFGSHASGGKGLVVAIIADDLTGALDAAAPLADRGYEAVFFMTGDIDASAASGARVISVSTDSREMEPLLAEVLVEAVARQIARLKPAIVIKKIDSRLKGNLEAEIRACRRAFGRTRTLVLPAIPEFRRVVSNGQVEGFGVATPLSISSALGAERHLAQVPDILRQEDFLEFIDMALEPDCLSVGARGFCEAIASRMPRGDKLVRRPVFRKPVLICIGSMDPISISQMDHFASVAGRLPFEGSAELDFEMMAARDGALSRNAAAAERDFIRRVVERIRTVRPRTLLLSGGRTASLVLAALGVGTMLIGGEILPGVCWSQISLNNERIVIITKSGGFGEPDLLQSVFFSSMT